MVPGSVRFLLHIFREDVARRGVHDFHSWLEKGGSCHWEPKFSLVVAAGVGGADRDLASNFAVLQRLLLSTQLGL